MNKEIPPIPNFIYNSYIYTCTHAHTGCPVYTTILQAQKRKSNSNSKTTIKTRHCCLHTPSSFLCFVLCVFFVFYVCYFEFVFDFSACNLQSQSSQTVFLSFGGLCPVWFCLCVCLLVCVCVSFVVLLKTKCNKIY